jgi:SAM-dependent methyltransferase
MKSAHIELCTMCQNNALRVLTNFGFQPTSSNYISNSSSKLELFNFSIGQCDFCGVVQLLNPVPENKLLPKFKWIKNNEPDKHADFIFETLLKYIEGENSKVLFVSKYDQRVFELVNKHLNGGAYMLDPKVDLGIDETDPGQIQLQSRINTDNLRKLSKKIGKFDLIVTCRMLEHAHNANEFISGLSELLKTDGHLVIEVPNSTKGLLQGDIAMLWDEHCYYFTYESLRLGLGAIGYRIKNSFNYYYPQEDALVSIFQNYKNSNINNKIYPPLGERELANTFQRKCKEYKDKVINDLAQLEGKYGDIAIFGAGHRSIVFTNLLKITKQHIPYVIDDDPNKKGLKLPGSEIRIRNSDIVESGNIGVILLAVGIEIEDKIAEILSNKSKSPLHFFSISPDSKYALSTFNDN